MNRPLKDVEAPDEPPLARKFCVYPVTVGLAGAEIKFVPEPIPKQETAKHCVGKAIGKVTA